MLWVHVGLDFENEAGEFRMVRGNLRAGHDAWFGRRRMRQEAVEQKLHAEIVDAASEEHRGGLAGEHGGWNEGFAGALEHFQFFGDLREGFFRQSPANQRIVESADRYRSAILAANGALE